MVSNSLFDRFKITEKMAKSKALSNYQRNDIIESYNISYATFSSYLMRSTRIGILKDTTYKRIMNGKALSQKDLFSIVNLFGEPNYEFPLMLKSGVVKAYNMCRCSQVRDELEESETFPDWGLKLWDNSYIIFPSLLVEIKKEMGEPRYDFSKFQYKNGI